MNSKKAFQNKFRTTLLCIACLCVIALIFAIHCSQNQSRRNTSQSAFERDSSVEYLGTTYHFVHIGNRVWMTRNLDAGSFRNSTDTSFSDSFIDKYCLFDDTTNCEKYGAIYRVDEAVNPFSTSIPLYDSGLPQNAPPQGVCPLGWHVATSGDWRLLIGSHGGIEIAGSALIEAPESKFKYIFQCGISRKIHDTTRAKFTFILNNPKPGWASRITNNHDSKIPDDQALSMLTSTVTKLGYKMLVTKWDNPSRFHLENHERKVYGAVRCVRND